MSDDKKRMERRVMKSRTGGLVPLIRELIDQDLDRGGAKDELLDNFPSVSLGLLPNLKWVCLGTNFIPSQAHPLQQSSNEL